MQLPTQLDVNTQDLTLAIRRGMGPMQTFFDDGHDGLPYFGNSMEAGEGFGNRLSSVYSLSHMPGR